ncbi:hypothetical protein EDC32_101386 [Laceyella sacchari]|jgi:hypothetical protein|uniref:Uncharacterized protein n=1 Tax=Laceyella tengchongensis TaxID=574699 RepID=A0AA46AD71_9BACL|nr:hypothetical protein EDC32_101386 [Laceyella sacchari]SMP03017.1 hypothetical protein SAMN06265361_101398 [Laceyella tengchongensis]
MGDVGRMLKENGLSLYMLSNVIVFLWFYTLFYHTECKGDGDDHWCT